MNKRDKNKFEMIGVVTSLGTTESAALAALPAAVNVINDLKAIHREIEINEGMTVELTKGKTLSKEVSKDELITMALVFAGALYGYAADAANTELLHFADISTRTLMKLRDSELPIRVEQVLNKSDELADALIPFGVTEAKRNDARLKLQDYMNKFSESNLSKGSKKTANQTIQMLFTNADKKLKVLDRLIINFKESNAELFNKYQAARVIYDKAATHKTEAPEEPVAP